MDEIKFDKTYKILINVYGLYQEQLQNYKIEFQEEDQNILNITNKIIEYNNEIFNFKIKKDSLIFQFSVRLIHNYTNEILIDLSENSAKRFNIDFRIEIESLIIPNIIIKNNNKSYEFKIKYNDLNIGRIVLLNTSLDLNIYLKDKLHSQNEQKDNKIKKYKKIILNLKNEQKTEKLKEKEKNENMGGDDKNKKETEKIKKIEKNEIKDYSLLGRKRIFKNIKKYEYEIKYSLDITSLNSNNILFCLNFYYFNNKTLTIHEINETINKNNNNHNKTITNEDIEKLYNDINNNINVLLKQLEEIDLIQFKEKLLNLLKGYTYDVSAVNSISDDTKDEYEYLLSMDYFYKYIICIGRNAIKKIIEKFYFYYTNPTIDEINFVKNNIKYILLKFSQFNDYVDYINNKNNKFEHNLILNKNNLSPKDKIKIFSILLTIILSSPIYNEQTKIEFFDINSNDKNVYFLAKNLLNKIIENLKVNSRYLLGLKQTFSRIKKDLNSMNFHGSNKNRDVFIIEMLSLSELKEKIKSFFPSKIIRFVNSRSFTNAFYDLVSGDILINEIIYKYRGNNYYKENNDNIIFDSLDPFIKGNINLKNDKDKYYYNLYIFKALWRINHESLGHKPVAQINQNKIDTPNKFIINGSFREINDAGNIIESFITEDNSKFNSLKNINFNAQILLNEKLFIESNFNKFWEEFEKIEKENKGEIKIKDNIRELNEYIYDIYEENIDLKIEKFIQPKNQLITKNKCKNFFKK